MEKENTLSFRGSNWLSLLPFLIFVVFCVLFFVVFKVFEMEALCMGGILALIIGSLFSKNWGSYWQAVVKGMASPMMNTLALILLVVGIFAKLMSRGGVAQGFVWLGDMLGLSGGMFVVFTFIATAVISMATGTSIGTLFSGFPILYPAGILLGANPVALAGAILSGAIFGDNVAPISDTTIASATSQSYTAKKGTADVGGCVASRMRYALVAGAIACVLFFIFGGGGSASAEGKEILSQYMDPKGLVMLIPVAVLLSVSVVKRDIFVAITWGIISGIAVGFLFGILTPADIMSVTDGALSGFAIDGIKNMLGTVGYLYAVAGIMGVLNESGTLDRIITALVNSSFSKTVIGSELIMGIGIMVTSICLGSANGPAIIMFGPVADRIGQETKLHPYRRSNLLDGFASTLPVIIPFTSAFIFIVVLCINGLQGDYPFVQSLSPISIAMSTYHCLALFVVFMFSVFSGWGRKYEANDGAPVDKVEYTTTSSTSRKA